MLDPAPFMMRCVDIERVTGRVVLFLLLLWVVVKKKVHVKTHCTCIPEIRSRNLPNQLSNFKSTAAQSPQPPT